MKIAVWGAGAVGAYFGGRLAATGAEVHLIARGAHLDALRERGLQLQSPIGNLHLRIPATDDPASIGRCDCVLFCVKSFDTEEAARSLPSLVHDGTTVLSLQNGIDNVDKLNGAIGAPLALGAATLIISSIAEPGVVAHTGGPARIVFGESTGDITARARELGDLFERAGVDVEVVGDVTPVLWNKFAFICAHAGMTAACRLPIGEIRSVPESRAMFRDLSAEVCEVGEAEGVHLPADTPERHLRLADGLGATSYSSLHYDLTHHKPMELDALHGTVVARAKRHGLRVPANEAVFALLAPWAVKYRRR